MLISSKARFLSHTIRTRLPAVSLAKQPAQALRLASHRWSSSVAAADDIHSLPWQYLRAADSSNFDPITHQRTDVRVDNATGKRILDEKEPPQLSIQSVSLDGNNYKVTWSDGLFSEYSVDWIQRQLARRNEKLPEDRVLWSNLTEADVRDSPILTISFSDLLSEKGMSRSLRALYQFGILLVTDTPTNNHGAGVAALGASLGGGHAKKNANISLVGKYRDGGRETMLAHGTDGPMRTLYGNVWSTSSAGQAEGTSVADSAYGHDGLPFHTDMTYYRDPPGLQIFTMAQPAIKGGESTFGDGVAVAEQLRQTDPEAFRILSNTVRRYRCIDNETGWHLEASGKVIEVRDGQIVGIRHNDLDRLPDLPPAELTEPKEVDEFYGSLSRAHAAWDKLISDDKNQLVVRLKPGDTMVVANQVSCHACIIELSFEDKTNCSNQSIFAQRCFHGRLSFETSDSTPRSVMGCYVRYV
jgi:alpha-ketoglutarate-dependent taurine dioxygenase